jgi:hypothetical protein
MWACAGMLGRSVLGAYCLVADSQPEALVAQARIKPTPYKFANNQTWNKYQQRAEAILRLPEENGPSGYAQSFLRLYPPPS